MKKKAFGPMEMFKDKSLSTGAFKMLAFLFSHAPNGSKAQHASVSYAKLQAELHLRCRSSVSHYIEELKERGWIWKVERNGSRPQTFFLTIPAGVINAESGILLVSTS